KGCNAAAGGPRKVTPTIGPAVESIALRALEKRRDARPQTAGEMARELIAAASVAGPGSPHPAMVAAAGAVTPAPIATPMPIFEEVVAPESNSSVAPLFGEVYAKTGSSKIRVLAGLGAVLLLDG